MSATRSPSVPAGRQTGPTTRARSTLRPNQGGPDAWSQARSWSLAAVQLRGILRHDGRHERRHAWPSGTRIEEPCGDRLRIRVRVLSADLGGPGNSGAREEISRPMTRPERPLRLVAVWRWTATGVHRGRELGRRPGRQLGVAYVFRRTKGGVDNWGQEAKLTAFRRGGGELLRGTSTIFRRDESSSRAPAAHRRAAPRSGEERRVPRALPTGTATACRTRRTTAPEAVRPRARKTRTANGFGDACRVRVGVPGAARRRSLATPSAWRRAASCRGGGGGCRGLRRAPRHGPAAGRAGLPSRATRPRLPRLDPLADARRRGGRRGAGAFYYLRRRGEPVRNVAGTASARTRWAARALRALPLRAAAPPGIGPRRGERRRARVRNVPHARRTVRRGVNSLPRSRALAATPPRSVGRGPRPTFETGRAVRAVGGAASRTPRRPCAAGSRAATPCSSRRHARAANARARAAVSSPPSGRRRRCGPRGRGTRRPSRSRGRGPSRDAGLTRKRAPEIVGRVAVSDRRSVGSGSSRGTEGAWRDGSTREVVTALHPLLFISVLFPGAAGAQLMDSAWPCTWHDVEGSSRSPHVGPATPDVLWTFRRGRQPRLGARARRQRRIYVSNVLQPSSSR